MQKLLTRWNERDGIFIVHGNGYQSAIITYGFGHLVELYEPNEYKAVWKRVADRYIADFSGKIINLKYQKIKSNNTKLSKNI